MLFFLSRTAESVNTYKLKVLITLAGWYLSSSWSGLYFPASSHNSSPGSPVSTERLGSEEPRVPASELFVFLSERSLVIFPQDVLDLLKCLVVSSDWGAGDGL